MNNLFLYYFLSSMHSILASPGILGFDPELIPIQAFSLETN